MTQLTSKNLKKKKVSTSTAASLKTKKTNIKTSASKKESALKKEENITIEQEVFQTKNEETKKEKKFLKSFFSVIKKIFSLKGRATRCEFFSIWSLSLPILFLLNPIYKTTALNMICSFFSVAVLLMLFCVSVRRFHDIGRSTLRTSLIFLLVFGLLNGLASVSLNPKLFSTLSETLQSIHLPLPSTSFFPLLYLAGVFLYFLDAFLPGEKHVNKYGFPPQKPARRTLLFTFVLSLILVRSFYKLGTHFYELVLPFIS